MRLHAFSENWIAAQMHELRRSQGLKKERQLPEAIFLGVGSFKPLFIPVIH